MTKDMICAYTKPGTTYPGYINVSREGAQVVLTVRGDPKNRQGAYVCGNSRDMGMPGRCTPGDQHCNNYCNLAPERGPMQDRPKPCEHIDAGETVVLTLSDVEWGALVAAINGG